MTLDHFLKENRGEIIKRTRNKVAARSSPPCDPTELEHGVPLFLSQLSATLEDEGVGGPDHPDRPSHVAHPAIEDGAALLHRALVAMRVLIDKAEAN